MVGQNVIPLSQNASSLGCSGCWGPRQWEHVGPKTALPPCLLSLCHALFLLWHALLSFRCFVSPPDTKDVGWRHAFPLTDVTAVKDSRQGTPDVTISITCCVLGFPFCFGFPWVCPTSFFRGKFMSDQRWSSCCALSDDQRENNNKLFEEM